MLDKEQIDNWKEEQLTMFQYWSNDKEGERDPRDMSPLDMVKEYHQTAGLALNKEISTSLQALIDFRFKLLDEEFYEVSEELRCFPDEINKASLLKELADLVYVTYGFAATFGFDLNEAVRRVHENNMGRMFQPDGSIKRREDGKILKNKDFPKVDLSDLV